MSDSETNPAPERDPIHSVLEDARSLIKQLEGSTVQRFCVQVGESRIEIERGAPTVTVTAAAAPAAGAAAPAAASAPEAAPSDTRQKVVAPLVGTYYGAPQPGAKPFVEVGDVVDKGQTVAIVEAMKIMNQVQADQPGRVAEITCKDGDWVEFQQVLMYLEPVGA